MWFKQDLKSNIYLLVLLFVAGGLRFFHIDYQSLWIDEINTIVQADPAFGFTETYRFLLANDVQPPLYFYVLKVLFSIFGYTSTVLRSLSAILGIFAVYGIYLLGTEIRSKRTGLIAATLLCFNYIHIFYSQEARPYTWLILFTTLSFYAMFRFIKNPTYKTAITYGIFTALMLYGHAYGLFNFGAQCVILFYYLWILPVKDRLTLIKKCLVAGISTFILYLPSLPFLLIAGNVTSSWIPMPGLDVFTNIFTEFFGHSELLVGLACFLVIVFLFKFLYSENENSTKDSAAYSSNSFVFVVLLVWILLPMLIALIRTYLTIPMIVPRYLLGLLPALLIILAIAIDMIRAQQLRVFLLVVMVILSVVDIFTVKKYYFRGIKSDMRGVSKFVVNHKLPADAIVSQIGWHYNYYFKNSGVNEPVIMASLNQHLDGLKTDSFHLKQFWFVDRVPVLEGITETNRQFLFRHFYETKKVNKTAAAGSCFTPKDTNKVYLNLNDFEPIKPDNEGQLSFFKNDSTHSSPVLLDKGVYTLQVSGTSKPEKPVNNINAHITVKLNGTKIGGAFLSNIEQKTIKMTEFVIAKKQEVVFEFVFDNDIELNRKDRNAYVSLVEITKIK
ncbi:MAG: glycosyltransferase family 39 protein [Bacteroidia bacterium]|nr:glycosyltransferase family 39 protein [Bacteroidia bacterium]